MLVADKQQTLEEYLVSVNARIDEVVAEILVLRTFKASVPWLALRILVCDPKDWPTSYEKMQNRVDNWLNDNALKEPQGDC